jgi:RNA polymerase sigma-70 factor (ECF subfamily)
VPPTNDRQSRVAAEAVARGSYGKLVALLVVRCRDVAAAEDALADAFAEALATWPDRGVPANPEGWLVAVARRKLIDAVRRRQTAAQATGHLALITEELEAAAMQPMEIPDRRLALMFACAHPAIEAGLRAPLILQTILGFDAATIASAFLVAPSTMGQRLSRGKAKIRQAGIPFAVPVPSEIPERLEAVLAAIYTCFTEGWSDVAGSGGRERGLAEEAIWLGRLTTSLLPGEPEALGLLALMLHAHVRRDARRNAVGDYVPLGEQDTALWDHVLIDEAEDLLLNASRMGRIGRYQLEAAVQSAHAARRLSGNTDWSSIVALYTALVELTGSPVAEINRAMALAENKGTPAGLAALAVLDGDPRLSDYQPYWAARAELAARSGDLAEADAALVHAIGLATDDAVRRCQVKRRTTLTKGSA